MEQELLDRAICFAVQAHAGQRRKDGTPFVLHPLEDAAIVSTMTTDCAVLAAAVLHDTVEDTDVTPQQIADNFGPRVYELVMHETENKRPTIPPSVSWRVRKEESLALLAESTDPAVKMLWLGDKLANMRALRRAHNELGRAAFNRFNTHDPMAHKWYYGTILNLLKDLSAYDAYREYEACYHTVFDNYYND